MTANTDVSTREVAHKVRGEVGSRLEWYETVLGSALRFFGLTAGGGLVTTVVFTGFLIQFHRPVEMALWPAVLFAAALLVIGLFHVGHAWVIRGWARGKLKIRRFEEDEFGFVDDAGVLRRLFSHLQFWPVAASGALSLAGVFVGLGSVYGS